MEKVQTKLVNEKGVGSYIQLKAVYVDQTIFEKKNKLKNIKSQVE